MLDKNQILVDLEGLFDFIQMLIQFVHEVVSDLLHGQVVEFPTTSVADTRVKKVKQSPLKVLYILQLAFYHLDCSDFALLSRLQIFLTAVVHLGCRLRFH